MQVIGGRRKGYWKRIWAAQRKRLRRKKLPNALNSVADCERLETEKVMTLIAEAKATTPGEKLTLLKQCAEVEIARQIDKRAWIAKTRAEFNKIKHDLVKLNVSCWIGCGREANLRHHVIQIQHGGINVQRNVVPLCHDCHAEIHPWLKESSIS